MSADLDKPAPALETGEPAEAGDLRYALRYAGSELAQLPFTLSCLKATGRENHTLPWRAQVLDFNFSGFSVKLWPPHPAAPRPEPEDEVELVYRSQQPACWRFRCVVVHVHELAGEGLHVGLRRLFSPPGRQGTLEMRQGPRQSLSQTLGLAVTSPHPLLYGHQSQLRLVDVNFDMGYGLETEDPLFLTSEGSPLCIHFALPGLRPTQVMGAVTWVQPLDRHRLRVGFQTRDMPFELYQALCRLFLHHQIWTPGLMREAGFHVRHVREDIRFRQAGHLADYAAVLNLRREARRLVGTDASWQGVPAGGPEAMAEITDAQSRLLTAWHGERLIGSVALHFPTALDTPEPGSSLSPSGQSGVGLPASNDCILLRSLVLADDFRGTDVLQGLFEQAVKSLVFSERHWLLTSASGELLQFYVSMGFKDFGRATADAPIADPMRLPTQPAHWVGLERDAIWKRQGLGLMTWLLAYGDLARYMLRRGLLPVSSLWIWRIRMRLWFAPLARYGFTSQLRQAYRKHLASQSCSFCP